MEFFPCKILYPYATIIIKMRKREFYYEESLARTVSEFLVIKIIVASDDWKYFEKLLNTSEKLRIYS